MHIAATRVIRSLPLAKSVRLCAIMVACDKEGIKRAPCAGERGRLPSHADTGGDKRVLPVTEETELVEAGLSGKWSGRNPRPPV